MVRVGDPVGPLAVAQSLAAQGLQVLPARYQDKAPIVKWRNFQDVRSDSMLSQWFGSTGQRNYWIMTGRMSNVVVIDCDNAAAEEWWLERIPNLRETATVETRKGHHYWFRLPEDWPQDKTVASWSVHPPKGKENDPTIPSFDVRADDTGVIAPPSVHESGHIYTWSVPLADALVAPPELLDGTLRAQAPAGGPGSEEGTRKDAGGTVRSMLTTLLAHPPAEGGRNDWLARVAGHYAKTYHNQRDLYDAHVSAANTMLTPPLSDEEYNKTVESIWRGEHERNSQRALDGDCGWLQSGGTKIMTQVAIKGEGDSKVYSIDEYADFDIQAKGVMLAEDSGRTYWVQIIRKVRGTGDIETIDAILPANICGDDRALRKWLAKFACTVNPPANMAPNHGTPGLRIQRYLESQRPPVVKVTKTLGWDQEILNGKGGFVCHDGIIVAEELLDCDTVGVKPDPALLVGGLAPHRYGFEHDAKEARRVLSEVVTFHNDETTSVFGAWWAACLLKPQIEERTALFPFMAIEAPSESGKTNGFFDLMTQLNGNIGGETQPTKAALRDMAAAHRNGIVWVDDLDDPAYLTELLRAATSGGTLTKMGEDRESVKATKIVSPIVISGEALGMGTQKALIDRAIILKVTSPTDRKSLHDPSRPQWDDVLALREQYPNGLHDVAGWMVQEALGVQEQVTDAVREGRRGGSGRAVDKIAIIRAGARLLDYLVASTKKQVEDAWAGRGTHAIRVEDWVRRTSDEGIASNENTLTLQVLPWALRTFQYPDRAKAAERPGDLDCPVFVKDSGLALPAEVLKIMGVEGGNDRTGPVIWFNTALLAQAFEREHRGRVERRTQTETALRDQADAIKAPSKRFKIIGGGGRTAYYRQISGSLAVSILERARGK